MAKEKTVKVIDDEYKQITPSKLKAMQYDLYDEDSKLILVSGLPSTGKTISCIKLGAEQVLNKQYDRLIYIRPVLIPEYGLLPGEANDKLAPYTRQTQVYLGKNVLEEMMLRKQIEFLPADLLQGNRFSRSFIVIDEAQNIPMDKTYAVLSRLGEDSKLVIIGDTSKGQQNKKVKDKSLLQYCIDKFADEPYAKIHTLHDESDILGDEVTKQIIIKLIPDFF